MATLGTMFAGSAYAMSGKTEVKKQGPPINASNQDEERFIQYVNQPLRALHPYGDHYAWSNVWADI